MKPLNTRSATNPIDTIRKNREKSMLAKCRIRDWASKIFPLTVPVGLVRLNLRDLFFGTNFLRVGQIVIICSAAAKQWLLIPARDPRQSIEIHIGLRMPGHIRLHRLLYMRPRVPEALQKRGT